MPKSKQKKVIIAMSGGVDSSVAAALLKKKGYDVTGIYLKLWKEGGFNDGNERLIKAIAGKIGISVKIIDARKEFKKKVVDYFLGEYQAGRTPNPCVVCNKFIKFKILFDELLKFNADYIATGHYARIISNSKFLISNQIPNPKSQILNKYQIQNTKLKIIYRLFTAKDSNKDQTYFLYTLTQKELSKILFPLGNYEKSEITKLAKKFRLLHLMTADSKCKYRESQNICFIQNKYPDLFLKRHLKLKKGDIVDVKRNIIGIHEGLPLYTIGQRRGIKIGGTGPYFVVGKNLKKNELIVSNNPQDAKLFQKIANLKNVNWSSIKPKLPLKVFVRTRYRNPLTYATIKKKGESSKHKAFWIKFYKLQKAVTPGQSAVFYAKNGEVLGGGMIKN